MIYPNKSPHFKALKQLYPLQMDAEEYAVAQELDRALAYADEAYNELSPSSAVRTLAMWEKLYELDGVGTIEDRRQALLSKYNLDSGIAEKHYIALALLMGFEIDIEKPPRMFRAGLSRAGDPCYDVDEQYIWVVECRYREEDCDALVKAFEDQKIPFTNIKWKFGVKGYFIDERSGEKFIDEDGTILVDERDVIIKEMLADEDGIAIVD